MSHTIRDKRKLINRVRRICGQMEGVERLLLKEDDQDCFAILQAVASCRGAMNGLMSEIIEGHIREHILDPESSPSKEQTQAANELIDVVRTYLK